MLMQAVGQVDTPLEWGAVAVVVGVILTFLAKYVLPLLRNGKGKVDSGAMLAEISTTVTAATRAELRVLLDEIRESKLANAAIVSTLQAMTVTLTALTERIQHLPTKVDLEVVSRDTRHDIRNAIGGSVGGVSEQVERRADEILRALPKQ